MMPQQQMMMQQQSGMVMQQPMGGERVPPGCPPGGRVVMVKYWGTTSWIICLVASAVGAPPCICQPLCLCDQAEYYVLGNELYSLSGAKETKPCCAQIP